MSSNEPVRRYLNAPHSQIAVSSAIVTERYPLLYGPSSIAAVNPARLPPPQQLAGMDLAYREQFYTDEMLEQAASIQINLTYLASVGIAIAIVLTGPVIPLAAAISFAGLISFLLVLNLIVRHNATPRNILLLLIGPPAAVMVAYMVSFLLAYRLVAMPLLIVLTLLVFARLGHRIFAFYHGWLYTHPRLRPASRRSPLHIPTRPNLLMLGGLLAGALIGGSFAPGVTILGLLAVCVFVVRVSPLHLYAMIKTVLGQYLTYGTGTTGAPGIWIPPQPLTQRRLNWFALSALLSITLAVGLDVFAPVEWFGAAFRDQLGADWHAQVLASPYAWMPAAFDGLTNQNRLVFLWMFPLALSFAAILPVFVLAAIYRAPLLAAEELRQKIEHEIDIDAAADEPRSEWQWYVDRVRTSQHVAQNPLGGAVREAEHLFLGVEPNAQFPVLLDRAILSEHCYMVGETGSGKTALGIMPLLIQLIRGHAIPENESLCDPVPVVILDLKGDMALFNTVRREAEARGQEFRFFTPEPGMASHHFNPFQSLQTEARSLMQLCQIFLDSLSLSHGEGYGRSYYTRRNRELLFAALQREPKPQSFEDLYKVVEELSHEKQHRECFELVSTIHALSEYPMLATVGPLKKPEQAIHMPSVLERRQIVYFWLPAAIESISVREIGKLALFSLLTAAIDRRRAGKPQRQAYLVIDEFQRLAGENFKIVLEQARSFGLSAIIANQTLSDLRIHDIDLRPTVRTNTRSKVYFSVSDPAEVRDLAASSGEEIAVMKSWSVGQSDVGGGTQTHSWSESLKTRLTVNDILRVSDHPLDFILQVSRGGGYTQFAGVPIQVRTSYPLSKRQYEERSFQTPWPTIEAYEEGTVVVAQETPREIDTRTAAKAEDQMRALFEKMENEQKSTQKASKRSSDGD